MVNYLSTNLWPDFFPVFFLKGEVIDNLRCWCHPTAKTRGIFVGAVPCWGSKEIDPRVLQRFTDVDKDHFLSCFAYWAASKMELLSAYMRNEGARPPCQVFPGNKEVLLITMIPLWSLNKALFLGYVCGIRGRQPLDSHDIRIFFWG